MAARAGSALTATSWLDILASAFKLFDDAESRGFGTPPFSLGGGTVLMLRFEHRLSQDIDLFGYDAQWLTVLSPRLSAAAQAIVRDYSEQANTIKLVMDHGDIDFIVAGDVAPPVERAMSHLGGRVIAVDPVSEILAKKLFYRAAAFKPRDVYDLAVAIALAPIEAARAVDAALPKADVLLRRLDELSRADAATLLDGIVPYGERLEHADGMVERVADFIRSRRLPAGSSRLGEAAP